MNTKQIRVVLVFVDFPVKNASEMMNNDDDINNRYSKSKYTYKCIKYII